ncbi:MAG TPA: LacI family DNA-binding transcriptional regulator [Rariglobus sp.]
MKAPSVTVNDVARSAGVSVGTVSRVLNGAANIAPENLEKVQKAMADLGYQKHHSAGLLAARRNGSVSRTGNIGMVYTEVGPAWSNHPLVAAYALGVEKAAEEKGFHSLIELSSDGSELPRCVRERKIDGLLIKATRSIPEFIGKLPPDLPVVLVGRNDPSLQLAQVTADNPGAGWLMADYLWGQGHRRVAFLCSDARHPMFIGRLQGYEGFMRERNAFDPRLVGLIEKPEVALSEPERTPPDFHDLVTRLLALPAADRPTALIAANDWMARGVYAVLAKLGLQAGRDISVVGFDNMPFLCETLVPRLTSFDVELSAVAHAATRLLLDMVGGPPKDRPPSVQLVRGRLIERASVARLTPLP